MQGPHEPPRELFARPAPPALRIGSVVVDPPVLQAPMAGFTNYAFRQVVRGYGGVGLQATEMISARGFAWLDDKVGAKPVIIVSLVAMIGLGTALLVVESLDWFWGLGILLGIFVGPAQSASRSLMARLAPEAIRTEMFGLYAFSGKATGFLGPIVLAAATTVFDSQRVGMGVIIVFFIVGLLLLLRVRET